MLSIIAFEGHLKGKIQLQTRPETRFEKQLKRKYSMLPHFRVAMKREKVGIEDNPKPSRESLMRTHHDMVDSKWVVTSDPHSCSRPKTRVSSTGALGCRSSKGAGAREGRASRWQVEVTRSRSRSSH